MDLILNLSAEPISQKKKKPQLNPEIPSEKNILKKPINPKQTANKTSHITERLPQNRSLSKSSISDSKIVKNTKSIAAKSSEKIDERKSIGKPKSTLDLCEDAEIKDIEAFLSATDGVNEQAVFSDRSIAFSQIDRIHRHLVKTLSDKLGIDTATEIQQRAIPALLDGRDALIKSATGSGKTLSYAIPLVNHLQSINPPINRESGIHALIIIPTQELAVQTQDVFLKLTNPFVRIVTGILMGGVRSLSQKRALKKGLNILIATPNRLLYHMEKDSRIMFDKLHWLVLDEADRITELGFAESIKKILTEISKSRELSSLQTVLLSATLTKGVESLAGLTLKNPFRAEVNFVAANSEDKKSKERSFNDFAMPVGLQHCLLVCPTKLRMVALLSFLLLKCKYGKHTGKVVVFMATQDLVEFHYQLFNVFLKNKSLLQEIPNSEGTKIDLNTNIDFFQLHGGMEHDKRQMVFRDFSACKNGFLLTTDVCSRGLDMTGINWVVQYHPPGNPIDYIHRVGRTARAGSKGKALLFLQPTEVNYINHLQTSVGGINLRKISLRSIMQTALHHAGTLKSRKSVHTVEESIFLTSKLLEDHVSGDNILSDLCRNAFKSLVKSYACFSKEMRQFFCYKDLHLGHVAKSLASCETPKEISKNCVKNAAGEHSADKKKISIDTKDRKRKSGDVERNNGAKKPKLDMAHRNMLAEFGL